MSLAIRSYTEFIIDRIKEEGILDGSYHSTKEVENDVIEMIWKSYEEWEKE